MKSLTITIASYFNRLISNFFPLDTDKFLYLLCKSTSLTVMLFPWCFPPTSIIFILFKVPPCWGTAVGCAWPHWSLSLTPHPPVPPVLICRKWLNVLCVNSKCHSRMFPINVNKEITGEGPTWVTNTSPAILHENSRCQADFTANSAVPVCKIDLKVDFLCLADYVRGCRGTVKEDKLCRASKP